MGHFSAPRAGFGTLVGMFKLRSGSLIGMVHVRALPGTPSSRLSIEKIASIAAEEARVLVDAGFDGVLIENMHDAPYVVGPQDAVVTAGMTAAGLAVREAIGEKVALGVQVLARGEREALAVGLACGASFVRCENFVFSHVADEGLMSEAAAGPLLRYRRNIGAAGIAVYADIQKKHAAHAITADVGIADHAHAAEFFGADGMIVTGSATGVAASMDDVRRVRGATKRTVLVGSGVTERTVAGILEVADGVIVGSSIKKGGAWANAIDVKRAKALVKAARGR